MASAPLARTSLPQSVASEEQKQVFVYLDNAETTRMDPAVLDLIKEFMVDKYGVPAGEFGYKLEEEAVKLSNEQEEQLPRKSTRDQTR